MYVGGGRDFFWHENVGHGGKGRETHGLDLYFRGVNLYFYSSVKTSMSIKLIFIHKLENINHHLNRIK